MWWSVDQTERSVAFPYDLCFICQAWHLRVLEYTEPDRGAGGGEAEGQAEV